MEQSGGTKIDVSERVLALWHNRLCWPIGLLSLYLLCIYAVEPAFFSATNLSSILYYTCLLVPAVVGCHLLIVLGLFDLSLGAVAAVCGVLCARSLLAGVPVLAAIFIAVSVGALFGLANWFLVSRMRIPALIATLITLGAARALALGVTQGQVIGGLPRYFEELTLNPGGGVSPVVPLGLLLVLLVEILTQRHIVFRRLYHVGSSRSAAASSGINVNALECMGFLLCGAGAALVGVLQSSRTLSASPLVFPDLALECIAACVIGGASLSGGKGRVVGAFVGMLMVVVSRNLAVLAGVSVYWKELAIAIMLFAAVLINRTEEKR